MADTRQAKCDSCKVYFWITFHGKGIPASNIRCPKCNNLLKRACISNVKNGNVEYVSAFGLVDVNENFIEAL